MIIIKSELTFSEARILYPNEVTEAMNYLRQGASRHKNASAHSLVWQVVEDFGVTFLSCHGVSQNTGQSGRRYMVELQEARKHA